MTQRQSLLCLNCETPLSPDREKFCSRRCKGAYYYKTKKDENLSRRKELYMTRGVVVARDTACPKCGNLGSLSHFKVLRRDNLTPIAAYATIRHVIVEGGGRKKSVTHYIGKIAIDEKLTPAEKPCRACGKLFGARHDQQYCSDECRNKDHLEEGREYAKQYYRRSHVLISEQKRYCRSCGNLITSPTMKYYCSTKCQKHFLYIRAKAAKS